MQAIFEQQAEECLARANCRPFVEGQVAVNWPERGVGSSGHKRATGILGFQRPRYGPRLTVASI